MELKEKKAISKIAKEQAEYDTIKWRDSEIAGKDTCGSYARCLYCDKSKKYPCVYANRAMKKAK